jgi:hypothetical protein
MPDSRPAAPVCAATLMLTQEIADDRKGLDGRNQTLRKPRHRVRRAAKRQQVRHRINRGTGLLHKTPIPAQLPELR